MEEWGGEENPLAQQHILVRCLGVYNPNSYKYVRTHHFFTVFTHH